MESRQIRSHPYSHKTDAEHKDTPTLSSGTDAVEDERRGEKSEFQLNEAVMVEMFESYRIKYPSVEGWRWGDGSTLMC
jgi:hypothetical protein